MSFNLQEYFSSEGRTVTKDAESIRAAAEALLAAPAGLTSNNSYKDWATDALGYLNSSDGAPTRYGLSTEQERLDAAYNWITGAMQPSKADSVFGGIEDNINRFQSDYKNFS